MLQRGACGRSASPLTGECPSCQSSKKLQKKMRVGGTDDPLEHEADRLAERALALPARLRTTGGSRPTARLRAAASGGERRCVACARCHRSRVERAGRAGIGSADGIRSDATA
jgi:hypothetical protein